MGRFYPSLHGFDILEDVDRSILRRKYLNYFERPCSGRYGEENVWRHERINLVYLMTNKFSFGQIMFQGG